MTFAALAARWSWRPIPGCPGRFVFSAGSSRWSPADLIGDNASVSEHVVAGAHDPVVVVPLTDGGLISYRKADGTYLHTLNSPEGFERKLEQLGIRRSAR